MNCDWVKLKVGDNYFMSINTQEITVKNEK